MQSELISALLEVSEDIRAIVSKLSGRSGEAGSPVLRPGELQALTRKLARVPKQLGRVSPGSPEDIVLRAALSEYAGTLMALKTVLARFQDSLAKRRDQLKKDLENTNLARAWVRTLRGVSC